MLQSAEPRWLLLIHQIPPKPDYLRVKIRRRLQKVGAVAIKNSVYTLPRNDQTLEDFQWTLREIVEGGGDASICEAGFVDGLSDDQVEALFKTARDADYAALADDARALIAQRTAAKSAPAESEDFEAAVDRLRRRLSEISAIDFFDSLGRQTAEGLVAELEAATRGESAPGGGPARFPADELRNRVWVTRKGLHVDRIASAWLIRRFIDPQAEFKFVPARGYRAERRELRFDMFDAEFTHEGDRCTFEVLMRCVDQSAPALRPLAEIVHDIDLKDARFGRPETAGVERLITGICSAHRDDESRLARGTALFDDLYESFARRSR